MRSFTNRKSIHLMLVLFTGFLLLTGCASKEADKAQETAAESVTAMETAVSVEPEIEPVLPSDAKIGIVFADGKGDFTTDFLTRMEGYLTAAGVPLENIERREAGLSEMESAAKELIGSGCTVLVAGNADPAAAGAVTKAASEAGIPVLYFGTDPGEDERMSWEAEKIRAAYVGGDDSKVAGLRASQIGNMDLEKIDFNEDGEIGLITVNSARDPRGNRINEKTLEALDDIEHWVNVLDEEEEEVTEEEDSEEENSEEENADAPEGTEEVSEEESEEETGAAEADTEEEAPEENGEEEEENEEEYEEEPDWQQEAYDEVVEKMGEYGRQLELIICAGDEEAIGAMNAVADQKRLVGHDVVILGLDAGEEILGEVAKGNIAQTFFDDSMAQARYAADYCLSFLRGGEVPYVTVVDYVNVTVDNAQEILDVLSATKSDDEEEDEDEEEAQG